MLVHQCIVFKIGKDLHVRRASRRYCLMCIYSALGLLAVRSIYVSTLGFLLAMLV